MPKMRKGDGFTLIELLIVIAIIAILALIAIPNFVESQTRAKVSRVLSDQRSIANAIEAYMVDYNAYPLDNTEWNKLIAEGLASNPKPPNRCMGVLTTPVAYMTSIPFDPFIDRAGAFNKDGPYPGRDYWYWAWRQGAYPLDCHYNYTGGAMITYDDREAMPNTIVMGFKWALDSWGPARNPIRQDSPQYSMWVPRILTGIQPGGNSRNYPLYLYDPTNGTISQGYIIRTNKGGFHGSHRQGG